MSEFFRRGQRASGLAREMQAKVILLQRLMSDEKKLGNGRQIQQALMDIIMVGDKISDHIRLASTTKLNLSEEGDGSTYIDNSGV